jgi:hypothetical protein
MWVQHNAVFCWLFLKHVQLVNIISAAVRCPFVQQNGSTALSFACDGCYAAMARVLLEAGADPYINKQVRKCRPHILDSC